MHQLVIFIAKYFIVVPPLLWLYLLWRLPKEQRVGFVIFSATSAIITAVLVKIATTVHQDPRPFVRDHVTPYFQSSTDNGFPSDHTVFASLLAFIAFRYRRSWGVALAILAVLIGTARVVSGVHHGQDIAGGFFIAAIGVALAWGIEKLVLRFAPKPAPPPE